MSPLQFQMLMETVATKWPNAPAWPDETVRDLAGELAPYSYVSAERAVGSLFRGDRARGFRPAPSTIAAAVRDFGDLDESFQSHALPGGCVHDDLHVPAVLVPAAARPFVPGSIPGERRAEFEAAVSGPTVLGGERRCRHCDRVELCLCGPCGSVRSEAARQLEEAS